jgi:hypothetical protein
MTKRKSSKWEKVFPAELFNDLSGRYKAIADKIENLSGFNFPVSGETNLEEIATIMVSFFKFGLDTSAITSNEMGQVVEELVSLGLKYSIINGGFNTQSLNLCERILNIYPCGDVNCVIHGNMKTLMELIKE